MFKNSIAVQHLFYNQYKWIFNRQYKYTNQAKFLFPVIIYEYTTKIKNNAVKLI